MNQDRRADTGLDRLPGELVDWLAKPFASFLRIEAAGGAILLVVTIAALVLSNSPWADQFLTFWELPVGIRIGSLEAARSLRDWINDALMTLFFFVVALELKRELVLGELRNPRMAALSIAAAAGGMLVPAAIYVMMQWGQEGAHGWGIAMATDTAFVIGCLAVLGRRIPQSLRVFMLSLAIVDDIGAILVVAIGYGGQLDFAALAFGGLGIAIVVGMGLLGIRSIPIYFLVGGLTWLAVDASGIHATVTGVILLGRQRLAVVVGGHHALAIDQILDRQVGGVTAIAVGHEIGRRRLVEPRRLDQVIDRHALPFRPKLAPLGDAMDVDGDLGLRQGLKLLPRPPASERSAVLQRQGPLLEWRTRRRAGAQHREVVGDELAGRNPISFGPSTAPAREASGRRRHERCLRGLRIRRTRNPRLNTGGSVRSHFYAQCE